MIATLFLAGEALAGEVGWIDRYRGKSLLLAAQRLFELGHRILDSSDLQIARRQEVGAHRDGGRAPQIRDWNRSTARRGR